MVFWMTVYGNLNMNSRYVAPRIFAKCVYNSLCVLLLFIIKIVMKNLKVHVIFFYTQQWITIEVYRDSTDKGLAIFFHMGWMPFCER